MPLSDDQKAMLRVLAQREEGYEDMAALMGISVEELRSRVKEALAEVEEPEELEEPQSAATTPPPVPPAPPAAPAPVVAAPAPPAPAAPPATSGAARAARLKLPKDRGALVGVGAGVVVLLGIAIALIVSGGGSGSGSSTSASSESAASSESLTQAILSPLSGGDASGRALFGRYKKSVLLQVEAEGLEPAPAGQAYTVWLYRSPKLALQIGAVPEREGKIAAQLQIPAQLLAYVASGAFDQVDVALTPTAAYKAALAKAKAERKLPPHLGESVLRGEITGPAIR